MANNINGRKRIEVPVNPNDGFHEIMACGGQSWGRGVDATEARKQLHKLTSSPVTAYLVVPKGAWVDDMGRRIEWDVTVAGDMHKDGACPLCKL